MPRRRGLLALGTAWISSATRPWACLCTVSAVSASGASTRQKILPFALVDPVAQVVHAVLVLGGQVGRVRLRHVCPAATGSPRRCTSMNSAMSRPSFRCPRAGLPAWTSEVAPGGAGHREDSPCWAQRPPGRFVRARRGCPGAAAAATARERLGCVELAQHRRDVVADRLAREHERLGDGGVGEPVGEQGEHLELSGGETRRGAVGPRRPRASRDRQAGGVPVAHDRRRAAPARRAASRISSASRAESRSGAAPARAPPSSGMPSARQRLRGVVPGAVEHQLERLGQRDRQRSPYAGDEEPPGTARRAPRPAGGP